MRVTVGVISYNGLYRVEHCVRSVVELSKDVNEIELILCDDGSRFEEARKNINEIEKSYSNEIPITVIRHNSNQGITRSWNDVVKASKSNIIVMLNDDILVVGDWLRCGLYFMENNEEAGMVGFPTWFCRRDEMPHFFHNNYWLRPRTPHGSKPLLPQEEVDRYFKCEQFSVPGRVACPVGCCFMFKKRDWERIKYKDGTCGFPEWLRSMYEDYTFAFEMMKLGRRNYMLRYPRLYHCLGDTFGSNPELKGVQQVMESRKRFIEYYGGDERQVMDKYYEETKEREERRKVKFIDGSGKEREEWEEQ